MEEETAGPSQFGLSLTMHDQDKIVLQQEAYGLSGPVIVVKIEMPDDDTVKALVECFGIGTDLTDVKGVGNLLAMCAEAIESEADAKYQELLEGDEDG